MKLCRVHFQVFPEEVPSPRLDPSQENENDRIQQKLIIITKLSDTDELFGDLRSVQDMF